VIGW